MKFFRLSFLQFVADCHNVFLNSIFSTSRGIPGSHCAFVKDAESSVRVVAASPKHKAALLPHWVVVSVGRSASVVPDDVINVINSPPSSAQAFWLIGGTVGVLASASNVCT